MEHLNFEITEMEHLNFLEFWEETRTAEQALGWKLGIMYTFIFWNTSIQIPNDAPELHTHRVFSVLNVRKVVIYGKKII